MLGVGRWTFSISGAKHRVVCVREQRVEYEKMEGGAPATPAIAGSLELAPPNDAKLRNGASTRPLLNRFNLLNDLVEVRPLAGLELGMEQSTIGLNFKRAAA
jgi:hypothetical protein